MSERERGTRAASAARRHAADRLCSQCLLEFGQYRDIDTNEILKLVTPEQGGGTADTRVAHRARSAEYERRDAEAAKRYEVSATDAGRGSAFEEKAPTHRMSRKRRSTRVVTSALRGRKRRARAPSASERARAAGGGKLLPGSVGGSRKRRVGRGRVGLQNGVRRVTE